MTRPETEPPTPLFEPVSDDEVEHELRKCPVLSAVAFNAEDNDSHSILDALAVRLAEKVDGGGGGDGDGPDFHTELKKQGRGLTWKILALVIVSALSSYTAMRLTVHDNAKAVEIHEKSIKTNGDGIVQNTDDIRTIKGDIGGMKESVDNAVTQQKAVVEGIETLKKEAQTDKQKRLEEKLEALQRENNRLRRRGR